MLEPLKRVSLVCVSSIAQLETEVESLLFANWPRCLHGDALAKSDDGEATWKQIYRQFGGFQLAALGHDPDRVIASGHCVPLVWHYSFSELPDSGWDWALASALATASQPESWNVVCALAITVDQNFRSMGVSQLLLQEVRCRAKAAGFGSLIAPVRPVTRPSALMSFEEFVYSTRPDGLPLDPWIRTHAKFGAEIVKICPRSMTVEGTLSQWLEWEGVQFTSSGTFNIPHLPGRIRVDVEADRATYIEPNVWMVHRL